MFRARFFALVFTFCGMILSGQVRADDLDRIRAQNDLKAQKLIAEVNAALAQSRTLEAVEAREVLRRILGRLEDDLVLTERQRASLVQQVRNRLRAVIQAARAQEDAEEAAAKKEVARTTRPGDRGGEAQGKTPGPSDTAKDIYKTAKDRLDAAKNVKLKAEKNRLDAQAEIDKSASLVMEQRITPRFLAATERRQQKLTAKEKALLKMLNSTLSVDFKDTQFKEVIEYLQEKTGQPIIIDEGSLKEANIESDEPVTFKVKKATVRTILKKILADKGLTYVIKEAAIQVVTPQKAREMMVVRTYPIGDLVGTNPNFDPFGFGKLANVQSLINVIKSSVEPAIWEQGATISFFPPGSLIIRGPAEMHYQMGFGGGYGGR